MKTIDLHPDYISLSDVELIEKIPSNTILPLTDAICAFYDKKLSISQVYAYYGFDFKDSDYQQQVHCLLPSHGSSDKHPSARYYPIDRNTGQSRQAVYCHKCQKTSTAFWLLYARESFLSGIHMRQFYLFINKVFRIPFPRHIFLEFDPQEYYVFEESEIKGKLAKVQYAETLLRLKEAKDPLYLSEMKKLWREI